MKIRFWLLATGFWFSLYCLLLAVDFYKGKTVRIVVGFSAGGGFDTYARVLSRHLPRHIPGSPTIIVDNMPGAGSLIAANHLYRVAKPDGLTIGSFIGGLLLGQVLLQVPALQRQDLFKLRAGLDGPQDIGRGHGAQS